MNLIRSFVQYFTLKVKSYLDEFIGIVTVGFDVTDNY
jgi:hypothetical protein